MKNNKGIKYKICAATFALCLSVFLVIPCVAQGSNVVTPDFLQNYFSFIPVYQENQDINADKPTLLMSGRSINNLAFLRCGSVRRSDPI